jgi:hypothetical protein
LIRRLAPCLCLPRCNVLERGLLLLHLLAGASLSFTTTQHRKFSLLRIRRPRFVAIRSPFEFFSVIAEIHEQADRHVRQVFERNV